MTRNVTTKSSVTTTNRRSGANVTGRAKRLVGLGGATTDKLYRTIASEGVSSEHRALRRHIGRHQRHRLHRTLFLGLGALNLMNAVRHLHGWNRLGALGIATVSLATAGRLHTRCQQDRQHYTPLLDRLDARQGAAHSAAADRAASTKSASGELAS